MFLTILSLFFLIMLFSRTIPIIGGMLFATIAYSSVIFQPEIAIVAVIGYVLYLPFYQANY